MAQNPSEMSVNVIATMMGNASAGSAKHTEMAADYWSADRCTNGRRRIHALVGYCHCDHFGAKCVVRVSNVVCPPFSLNYHLRQRAVFP